MNPLNRSHRILIVEDDEAICFGLKRIVTSLGLTPLVAANGESALSLARQYSCDISVGFIDYRLPDCDGTRVIPQLRVMIPELRCCLMTAFRRAVLASPEWIRTATPILDKPFSLEEFTAMLQSLLHLHHAA